MIERRYSLSIETSIAIIAVLLINICANGADDAPLIAPEYPAAGAVQIPTYPIIHVKVTDEASDLDLSTVIMEIDEMHGGGLVYDGSSETAPGRYVSALGTTYRAGDIRSCLLYFQPAEPFAPQQSVKVTVTAENLAGEKRVVSYSFTTIDRFFANHNAASQSNRNSNPVIAIGGSSDVWLVWEKDTGANVGAIYAATAGPELQEWGTEHPIAPGMPAQRNPTIATLPNGEVILAWEQLDGETWKVFAISSADGENWIDAIAVDGSAAGDQLKPRIASSLSGDIFVAWEDYRTDQPRIHIASASAAAPDTWTHHGRADQGVSEKAQTSPSIAIDETVQVYLVWEEDAGLPTAGLAGIRRATDGTSVYGAVTGDSRHSPAIAVESAGNVHIAWIDETAGSQDVFYAKTAFYPPPAPLAGFSITDDTSNAAKASPVIAIIDDGGAAATYTGAPAKIFVAWQDARMPLESAPWSIYMAETGYADGDAPFGTNILVSSGVRLETQPALCAGGIYKLPYIAYRRTWIGKVQEGEIWAAAGAPFPQSQLTLIPPTEVSAEVGARLRHPDYFESLLPESWRDVIVDIPPNALPTDATIFVRIGTVPSLPIAPGIPYEFSPSGLEFAKPVTVTLRHTRRDYAGSGRVRHRFYVSWHDPLYNIWSRDGISNVSWQNVGGPEFIINFQTNHFSTFCVSDNHKFKPKPLCFIATAAYGTPMAEEVEDFRRFRDQYLLSHPVGEAAVNAYYFFSPPIAAVIKESPLLKGAARAFLTPLSRVVRALNESDEQRKLD